MYVLFSILQGKFLINFMVLQVTDITQGHLKKEKSIYINMDTKWALIQKSRKKHVIPLPKK